ncbi:hypothetical protein DHW03_08545 [Pedobacter yonginense]|uniref:Uncharacterized protein n=1 Tax=Pedobacter yonginense TaxID=651869 RepID=A0A317EMJ2_9SPHI|nr:hypothetical protein [Pedobacter yonginense]PWS27625.1 hypothetical protein DHW03_08545 [Pedobacter yonginense]
MNALLTFLKNFFLASGIIWVLAALSIITFGLNFQRQEIIITLILPLAYAIVRIFDQSKNTAN